MSSAPLCFTDIESDGVHPWRKVWEIAVIRREPDGQQDEWQAFVDIDLGATPDGFGLGVGGFYDRHPSGRFFSARDVENLGDALTPELAAIEVARLTHGAHIVGAVPNFDTETLAPLLRAHGLLPGWHYHLIDVENLAVGFLAARGEPIAPPWKSDELAAALGLAPVPDDERHTALGDAKWALRMYDAVMGGGPA